MIPRPARNNNPGDLEAHDHWQGLMPIERLTPMQKHERFAVFESPEMGFRAMVVILRNYKRLYGCNTVDGFITRWAPPTENPTNSYVGYVCALMSATLKLEILPDTKIDVDDPATMFALAKAIATDETGSWAPYWADEELHKGMQLAGYQTELVA